MRRRHHYRRLARNPAELDMTTFLNLMVVLIPFLLVTAVFSRITIVELSLPSAQAPSPPSDPGFRVEVIVREGGLEVTNGRARIASIPVQDGAYDLDTLGEFVVELKQQHPDVNAASVLLEPEIAYDHLIQVMDRVRSAELPAEPDGEAPGEPQLTRVALFTDISIGDAP
jgi:biopolymer transport protein ExbD